MALSQEESADRRACPFQDALEMLGRKHTLSILWYLQQDSPLRFNEIKDATGVNPVTLSSRLQELQSEGVVSRTAYDEVPPRVDYDLTDKGDDLLVILDDLQTWADRHHGDGAGAAAAGDGD